VKQRREAVVFRVDMPLLSSNLLLSPTWECAFALNCEAVSTIATAEPTNPGTQATKSVLLRALSLLHGLCKWSLRENRKAHCTSVLSPGIEVGWSKETSDGGGTIAV